MKSNYSHAARPTEYAKTKIVATVGPACSEQEQLAELIRAGVSVFRVNMAHGSTAEKETVINRIRAAAESVGQVVGVLIDLGGPKIRLTMLPNGMIDCRDGDEFKFVRGNQSTDRELAVTYDRLIDELELNDRIVLADGAVSMTIVAKEKDHAIGKVTQPGVIRSRQGVNLPGVKLSVKALSDIDREHAVWAANLGVDFIGMSFVRTAPEVRELQTLLKMAKPDGPLPKIVAKIEKGEALENLEEIVLAADGVMVARGDLGVEIDVARLAVEQKRIIALCNRHQKPVITATQMLDSMTHSKHPTRAEATDVANAILDGTDACMLSGETAVGDHPALVVRMMNRIALATEPLLLDRPPSPPTPLKNRREGVKEITHVMVYNAAKIADQMAAQLIVVATQGGLTACGLSKQRGGVPIVGVSDNPATLRQMCLFWGVTPLPGVTGTESTHLLKAVDDWGVKLGRLLPGQRVVLVGSTHWSSRGHNVLIIHEVSDPAV